MSATSFLYLASQSPRRRQLLEQIGVRYQLLLPNESGDIAEDAEAIEAVLPSELPEHYVQRVTGLKLDAAVARHVRRGLAPAPILCSDTTVALGNEILGKPESPQHAAHMLQSLADQTHKVLTAVAIQHDAQRFAALSISHVTFAPMSKAEVDAYVASGEPMGKAGAYGIQGRVAAYVARIDGSYSGIMGLPVFETSQLLKCMGWTLT